MPPHTTDPPDYTGARVLITGIGGFVGASVAEGFSTAGVDVHGSIRDPQRNERIQELATAPTLHQGDIADEHFVDSVFDSLKPSIVVHCAAHGGNQAERETNAIIAANVNGTVNLLRAAHRNGCRAFIYTGSSSEYGITEAIMNEDDRIEPMSEYAITKAAGTHWCTLFAKREGLNTATLRLFTIYGPKMARARLIPVAMRAAAKGLPLKLTGESITHDFVYIDDVVRAVMLAAGRDDLGGAVMNLATGIAMSNAEVVDTIERVCGKTIQREVGEYAAHSWDALIWHGDNQEALKRLGWSPAVSLDEGIGALWRFYDERGWDW